MSDEFKKEIKIVNNYGSLLEKYAGYWVVDEKYLRNKKKDIQKAIKMLLVLRIADNQKYDDLTTGYMQLGIFQKYKNFTEESMLDPDPVKYLEISKKHKKMRDKVNKEQDELYKHIELTAKVLKEEIKKKLKSK
tara:strand:+ start:93 stop:494 length:402 start_codon:yes stop_codon:yes gene_type:complete